MKLLAFDCSMGPASVAVHQWHDDGRHRADELGLVGPGGKADDLVAMIADALAHAGLAVTDLDRICVTTGPGSFTGVRVG
ncbi:MAG: tRNA (adenosine(37)-N6)-threonylcarbamoyltransferase complex dimerization subunit type 1 TsaB, partial [Hyphomicrobiaceae bacterium]